MEWISVNDKLPNKTGWCVCLMKDFDVPMTHYWINEGKNFNMDDSGRWEELDDVTHWMPLPQPPKGK